MFDRLSGELTGELALNVISLAMNEVSTESITEEILFEVAGELLEGVARYELTTYQKRLEYDMENIDKQLISGTTPTPCPALYFDGFLPLTPLSTSFILFYFIGMVLLTY